MRNSHLTRLKFMYNRGFVETQTYGCHLETNQSFESITTYGSNTTHSN